MTLPVSWDMPIERIAVAQRDYRLQVAHETQRQKLAPAVTAELRTLVPTQHYIHEVVNRRIPEFTDPVHGWEITFPLVPPTEYVGSLMITPIDAWLYVIVDREVLNGHLTLEDVRAFTDRLCHRQEVLLHTTVIVRNARENESERPYSFYPAVPAHQSLFKTWLQWLQRINPLQRLGIGITSDERNA